MKHSRKKRKYTHLLPQCRIDDNLMEHLDLIHEEQNHLSEAETIRYVLKEGIVAIRLRELEAQEVLSNEQKKS